MIIGSIMHIMCFNPCFNGTLSETLGKKHSLEANEAFQSLF